jgi:cysteine synthase A
LEHLNPGYSKKDRVARQIVEDALSDGALVHGQPVVELTSGNTGTGLAIVCAHYGCPFIAVMSRGNSPERARMMSALGAEVVLVDQTVDSVMSGGQGVSGADLELVEKRAVELVVERGAFRADQFNHRGNYRAHYLNTGPEAWEQSSGSINGFVDFVGSGGTFGGVSAYLKERNAECRCFVVEPAGAAVLNEKDGGEVAAVVADTHRIQGGGYSRRHHELPLLQRLAATTTTVVTIGDHKNEEDDLLPSSATTLIDGYVGVTDHEAALMARRLAREEGIFGGYSAGANVEAARRVLEDTDWGREGNRTVLAMVCDSGLKYLSTDLWEE